MTASTATHHSAALDQVDVDAYFDRIGHHGPRDADLDTLTAIAAHHTRSIPFENLDPLLGRPVRLDPESLRTKLVDDGRGGYCFEQNLLLSHVLEALGFTTTNLAARVLWNRDGDAPLPARQHMLVRVDLPEGPYVVDVGFGALTPTGPLQLVTDTVLATPHEVFRFVAAGDDLDLQARVRGEWRTLYRFGDEEHLRSDYEMSSWYLSNHPESHFVTGLTAARAVEGGRHTLAGKQLTFHQLGGETTRTTLTGPGEVIAALENTLLVDLSGLDRLTLLRRLIEIGI